MNLTIIISLIDFGEERFNGSIQCIEPNDFYVVSTFFYSEVDVLSSKAVGKLQHGVFLLLPENSKLRTAVKWGRKECCVIKSGAVFDFAVYTEKVEVISVNYE